MCPINLVAPGCSFGGSLALRHPDIATGAVSMGGAFDIHKSRSQKTCPGILTACISW
jgi:esterase/lipase superfamily enzyme